ncbi:MAG TPA: trehalase family glycosidase [Halalkalibaculum sp.]|nr:trehalase family glycosidase [Halalkalibaculum sp.]
MAMDIEVPEPEKLQKHAKDAKKVLADNRNSSFTKPSAEQYPHQWSWDAAFISMGYTHYLPEQAEKELLHLFEGQWKNGMVPHIVFSENKSGSDGEYFPGPKFWQTGQSDLAPNSVDTSGICQPPIHATAVRHHLKYASNNEKARDFAQEIFPRLKDWHNYLHRERDLHDEGLVYIRHPWESGQDNSPAWDEALEDIDLDSVELPEYQRKDILQVDGSDRPTNKDYDYYIHLVSFFREREYSEEKIIADNCPFLMQDVLFNTLYCQANYDLAAVARIIGKSPEPFERRADKTAAAINEKLWDNEHNMYIDYNMRLKKQVHAHILSGFIPLFAGIPNTERALRMFNYLNTSCFCRLEDTCLAAPSYDRSGTGYSSRKYWRGPVWINMNWLLNIGLDRYGFSEYAEQIRHSIIKLSHKEGFMEYYDPDDGSGYGTDRFSWSASLLLDVLYTQELI